MSAELEQRHARSVAWPVGGLLCVLSLRCTRESHRGAVVSAELEQRNARHVIARPVGALLDLTPASVRAKAIGVLS